MWRGRLTAQLARTEEAAKRALVASDRGAKGGVAGRLLATERELARVTAERADALRARRARLEPCCVCSLCFLGRFQCLESWRQARTLAAVQTCA